MSESKHKHKVARAEGVDGDDAPQIVDTLGGRVHVRWDRGAAATPQIGRAHV